MTGSCKAAFNAIALPVNVGRVLGRSRNSDAVVIHNGRFKAMPAAVTVPLLCRSLRGRLRSPANLTIVLLHNYRHKTLMERCLEYVGITDYTLLRASPDGGWLHTLKITSVLAYLKSGACRTEYLLYCDADDTILHADPARAVEVLTEAACDMLVSCTRYGRYHGLAEAEAWAKAAAPADVIRHDPRRYHMNAGVYIARTAFLRDFLEQAAAYVTANDLLPQVFQRMNDAEARAALPDLPRGSGDDQLIFRYLAARNYPALKVDYSMHLALR